MRNKHLSQHLSVSNLFVFSLTILVQRREHVQCYFNNCSYDILQSMCSSNTNKCLPSCHTSWRRTDLYDLDPHLVHDSLGLTSVCPKRYSDWFSHFCTAHPCAQHTDRQTHTPRHDDTSEICSNRSFHCTAFRRRGLKSLTIAEKLRHTLHITEKNEYSSCKLNRQQLLLNFTLYMTCTFRISCLFPTLNSNSFEHILAFL